MRSIEAFSNAAASCSFGSVRVCQSMSRKQAARYSTVSKPWLKSSAFLIFSTRASGMGSPVL